MSNPTMPAQTEPTMKEKLDAARAQREALAREEAKTGNSGAIPFTPKQSLLAGSAEEAKNPDLKYRWLNIKNDERIQARQLEGYVRVPLAEGGRQVGNLARFAIPRQEYDRRVAAQQKLNHDRLNAHKTEVEKMAEAVMKDLRDNHGLKVNILVKDD